ncbi:MAG TPA: GTPase [Streptosporangiaceae bacterium]|nr:GTPase [Streptosporangiaceae bacterium]
MTEGQDAATAPLPWIGGTPAAPDRGLAGSGRGTPAGVAAMPSVPATGVRRGSSGLGNGGTGWPAAAPDRPAGTYSSSPGWPQVPRNGGSGLPTDPPGSWSAVAGEAGVGPGNPVPPEDGAEDEPFARVDARRLEAALLDLRHPIVTVPLMLEAPGVAEARAERVKLLSQIDDYLLPRLRQSGAPILVALVGSTGAGKSTLMNTVVGKQVSATGIRRPTTNSPVLACHPDDMRWFAENVFLPTLPRVRQQGLAMPGRDGLLVLAASEGMPQGVAILDTPDIDSVVQAHHDFAHQFLDASDLWLFVTTARRYADAAVWEMLKDARDRGAALAVALSRVPSPAAAELSAHFDAMLDANGLGDVDRFIVPETTVRDAMLPTYVAAPVRDWLADTARREDRRVAVLTQTMSGVLDTFRNRVPALADQVTEQLALRRALGWAVEEAYTAGLAEIEEATRSGSLLQGEVLARWQDFAGTGDLLRTLQVRRGRGARQKKQHTPARASALKDALQASIESVVVAVAGRAAESVVASWQLRPAGASLLGELDATSGLAGGERLGETDFVASALADLGLAGGTGLDQDRRDSGALSRPTGGLAAAAAAVVSGWQARVLDLVRAENVTKRSIARVVSFDDESLALVLTIALLAPAPPPAAPAAVDSWGVRYVDQVDDADEDVPEEPGAAPQRLLSSLFGAALLREMGSRVRQDLRDRVGVLFQAEARRFFEVIDSAGVPDETAATELLQAGYALEGAR